ncbi:DUF4190 domain-containing protein [Streptomyces sp. H27-C3]|uniref:DUF4190 domain-containing protein n=1 Tax=Streptomyces sp. H27-C3 TaxID=3046305 RepID=UPI0024BB05C3|nr:DUF4190 domain-containing protein [Streptomyces sp. H27-C3]MDJ0460938.1 DUF4190 domain-containing protein [Streptomyces sp. H27-C3]
MSDNADNAQQPSGPPPEQPRDPWAPPEHKVPLDKPQPTTPPTYGPPQVHDQQTVTSMPISGGDTGPTAAPGGPYDPGAVPPPPAAPNGQYGYPSYPSAGPSTPPPYGQSAAPSYGYPGYPSAPQSGWTGMQAQPQNGMGTTAMVLGILAVCLFCVYGVLSIILGVLALIFGILGRKRVERGEATNSGMALAGIILGGIGIAIGAVVVAFVVWGITMAVEDSNNDDGYSSSAPYSPSQVVDARR